MLIGITGQKRTGKNTIADYLTKKYKFNQHGFADKVKAMLYAINPTIEDYYIINYYEAKPELAKNTTEESFNGSLQSIVDAIGWEQAKEIPEVRQLLQRLGTEGGRQLFGENFWVDKLFEELDEKYQYYYTVKDDDVSMPHKTLQSNIIISDCRFDNEAQRILDYGGYIIKVERDGLPVGDTHASEQPISPKLINETVSNNGTIEDLHNTVELMLIGFDFVKPIGINETPTHKFDNLGTTTTL